MTVQPNKLSEIRKVLESSLSDSEKLTQIVKIMGPKPAESPKSPTPATTTALFSTCKPFEIALSTHQYKAGKAWLCESTERFSMVTDPVWVQPFETSKDGYETTKYYRICKTGFYLGQSSGSKSSAKTIKLEIIEKNGKLVDVETEEKERKNDIKRFLLQTLKEVDFHEIREKFYQINLEKKELKETEKEKANLKVSYHPAYSFPLFDEIGGI